MRLKRLRVKHEMQGVHLALHQPSKKRRAAIDCRADSRETNDPVGRTLAEWDRPNGLQIKRISVPLFKYLQGICHTYIHQAADPEMAKTVTLNAKLRRLGICGATETLLFDKAIVDQIAPTILDALLQEGCEVRGDKTIQKLNAQIKAASADDWDTEYLDKIISVKVVDNVAEAIDHINTHGSQYTDAIITDYADADAAKRFLNEVDSAITIQNASTQFAGGGEFGMGAEIGIATGKLHARGPVGVEQLTTFKYQVFGAGQVRPK